MSRRGVIPAAAVALALSAPAFAGGAAGAAENPERGHDLAVRWCVACHVVDTALPGGDAGPPFARIATALPGHAVSLRAWLTAPHDPMPDFGLSQRDIADILAYLRTLAP